mmetsp:Transcript_14866/g.34373  ORF Transcript_14866/g.34373 Transcript_14866/m.34373 type:complete len:224 (+) Transcript_14866:11-682(+)
MECYFTFWRRRGPRYKTHLFSFFLLHAPHTKCRLFFLFLLPSIHSREGRRSHPLGSMRGVSFTIQNPIIFHAPLANHLTYASTIWSSSSSSSCSFCTSNHPLAQKLNTNGHRSKKIPVVCSNRLPTRSNSTTARRSAGEKRKCNLGSHGFSACEINSRHSSIERCVKQFHGLDDVTGRDGIMERNTRQETTELLEAESCEEEVDNTLPKTTLLLLLLFSCSFS